VWGFGDWGSRGKAASLGSTKSHGVKVQIIKLKATAWLCTQNPAKENERQMKNSTNQTYTGPSASTHETT
jgi:hypothetical protein